MVVIFCGMGSGQFLLNVADPVGFELFVLASVLVSIALIPILLTVSPAPEFHEPSPISLRALYRISPLGILGTLGTGMAHGGLAGMGAVYAKSSGLSVAEVSFFMAATLFGGMLFQWPIGRLSDRFDRRRVITAVTIFAALLAFTATVVTGPLASLFPAWSLFLLAGLFGGMNMPMYSLTIAHTNDFLEPKQMVAASGTLVLVGGIGAVLGPMRLAGAMSVMGPQGFFRGLGVVHAVVGIFALYRMTVRRAMPLADQGAYVPVPLPASPVAAGLTPEHDDSGAVDGAGESV